MLETAAKQSAASLRAEVANSTGLITRYVHVVQDHLNLFHASTRLLIFLFEIRKFVTIIFISTLTIASPVHLIVRLEADLESQMKRSGGDNNMGGKRKDNSLNVTSNQGGVEGSGGSMELSELLGVDIATLSSSGNNTSNTNINTNTNTNTNINDDDGMKKCEGGSVKLDVLEAPNQRQNQNQQMVDILQAQRDRYKDRLATVRYCTVHWHSDFTF